MSAVISVGKANAAEEAAVQRLTMVFLLLPVLVAGIFLYAFVLLLFWNWFVVPLGLKPLVYWHALGLSLFVSFLRGSADRGKEETRNAQDWKRTCKGGYVSLAFFWVSGWLVHVLMGHAGH